MNNIFARIIFWIVKLYVLLFLKYRWNSFGEKMNISDFIFKLYGQYIDIYYNEGLMGVRKYMKFLTSEINDINPDTKNKKLGKHVISVIKVSDKYVEKIELFKTLFHKINVTIATIILIKKTLTLIINIMFIPIIALSVYAISRKVFFLFSIMFTSTSLTFSAWDLGDHFNYIRGIIKFEVYEFREKVFNWFKDMYGIVPKPTVTVKPSEKESIWFKWGRFRNNYFREPSICYLSLRWRILILFTLSICTLSVTLVLIPVSFP